ncbi:MAG: TAXI family TRAP transporter solute-binding subunit [Rhodospirillales bacterium]|nr:MAG: TAXI family TRAP transporter solute-binding subunit [Rhodospirillales bacterium]
MPSRRSVLAAAVPAAILGGGVRAQRPGEERHFLIGSGPIGGTYFPIAGLISAVISNPPGGRPCEAGGNCGIPGLVAEALATQGSVENLRRLGEGALDSALAQADIGAAAYRGDDLFSGRAMPLLRSIANLFTESVHVVVRRGTGLESVADLRGRTVSMGERESGTLPVARTLMAAYGLGRRDIDAVYLSPQAASARLREGAIDAFVMVAGEPAPLLVALARQSPVDLLPVSTPVAERLRRERPWIGTTTVGAEHYDGIDARQTITVAAHWLTSAAVDGDTVHGNLRALFHPSNRARLDRGHPSAAAIRLETAIDGLAVPLHEGAQRFYRERGVLKD